MKIDIQPYNQVDIKQEVPSGDLNLTVEVHSVKLKDTTREVNRASYKGSLKKELMYDPRGRKPDVAIVFDI